MVSACQSPIALEPAPVAEQIREAHRSALVSDRLSPWTARILTAERIPVKLDEETLARLLALVQQRPDAERLIALAEVAFAVGDAHGGGAGRGWEAMTIAALASWTALFSSELSLSPFDAAWALARQIHNASLAQVVIGLDALPGLETGTFERDFLDGTIRIDYAWAADAWSVAPFRRFYAADSFRVRGMRHRHRQFGIGATLVADRRADPEMIVKPTEAHLPIGYQSVALSAVVSEVSYDTVKTWRPISFQLRIVDSKRTRSTEIAGRDVPLEADFTSAFVGTLAHDRPSARAGFGGLWDADRWQDLTGIYMLEPYDPDRIPVVFVHGLVSSPLTWREMFNDLWSVPEIRERYQFWFFMYPTGNPFAYSASLFRRSLRQIREKFDPDGRNARFDEMVVIGHSMGGLLTRMLVTDLRDGLWDAFSDVPVDEAGLTEEDRALAEAVFFEPPLPWIRRVIFIAVPHRGSALADLSISRIAGAFVRLPPTLLESAGRLFAIGSESTTSSADRSRRIANGIDSLSPRGRVIVTLSEMPMAPDVAVHSIIGRNDAREGPGGTDGVVRFESSHVPGAESELVISGSDHAVPLRPEATVEVLRILRLHLRSLGR